MSDDVVQMIAWLRERADTSEKGAAFCTGGDEALADDMMEDVRKFREAADLLTRLAESNWCYRP